MTEPHDPHGEPPQPSREEALAHLDERLAWARADIEQRDRLTRRAEHTRRHLVLLTARVGKLQMRTESERRDVDDVTGPTVVALLEQLFGDLEARQDKEIQEWLAARLKLEQAQAELAATQADLMAIEQRLAADADPRDRYVALLEEKTRWLERHTHEEDTRLMHLAEREGVLRDTLRELEEAHFAGGVAKAALTGLLHALSKAQALGRLDMVGLASSFGKFSHLDDAQRHASAANRALSRFQMELEDVQARHQATLRMEITGSTSFADAFLDDLVSDWVVQCRIDRSHTSAGIARTRVNRTLTFLVTQLHELRIELRGVHKEQKTLREDGERDPQ